MPEKRTSRFLALLYLVSASAWVGAAEEEWRYYGQDEGGGTIFESE